VLFKYFQAEICRSCTVQCNTGFKITLLFYVVKDICVFFVCCAMAQLVQAMGYKPEGRGLDFGWCHWNFSLTKSFRPHSGPGVDSASNRNEYQEYFLGGKGGRCVGLTTLPPSCADCLEI